MANRYADDASLAPAAPQPAQPISGNRYADGVEYQPSGASEPVQAEPTPDKYHQRAAQFLDEQKAAHGGREISGGGMNTFLHGATAGLGNRFVAGLHAIAGQALANDGLPFMERMKYELALEQEKHRRASEGAGGSIGEFAGAVVNPLNKIGGARFLPNVASGAVQGGVTAAADGGNLETIGQSAALGAGGAAVGNMLGRAIGAGLNKFAPQGSVPEINDIRNLAKQHEDAFVNSGVEYNRGGADELKKMLEGTLDNSRYRTTSHPEIAKGDTLKQLETFVQNTPRPFQAAPSERSVLDIRDLSRVIQREQGSVNDSNQARMLSELQKVVRDFPANVNPSNVIKGNSAAAGQSWKSANNEYTKVFKAEALRDALKTAADKATVKGSGGNANNDVRSRLLRMLESRGDWTPDEEAGIRAVMGEGEDKFMRSMSKMAPQGNGLMQMLGWTGALNNPVTAVAPAVGQTARMITDAEQEVMVRNLDRLIRSGGNANNLPKPGIMNKAADVIPRNISGPFAQIFASQLAPAPVRGK